MSSKLLPNVHERLLEWPPLCSENHILLLLVALPIYYCSYINCKNLYKTIHINGKIVTKYLSGLRHVHEGRLYDKVK